MFRFRLIGRWQRGSNPRPLKCEVTAQPLTEKNTECSCLQCGRIWLEKFWQTTYWCWGHRYQCHGITFFLGGGGLSCSNPFESLDIRTLRFILENTRTMQTYLNIFVKIKAAWKKCEHQNDRLQQISSFEYNIFPSKIKMRDNCPFWEMAHIGRHRTMGQTSIRSEDVFGSQRLGVENLPNPLKEQLGRILATSAATVPSSSSSTSKIIADWQIILQKWCQTRAGPLIWLMLSSVERLIVVCMNGIPLKIGFPLLCLLHF